MVAVVLTEVMEDGGQKVVQRQGERVNPGATKELAKGRLLRWIFYVGQGCAQAEEVGNLWVVRSRDRAARSSAVKVTILGRHAPLTEPLLPVLPPAELFCLHLEKLGNLSRREIGTDTVGRCCRLKGRTWKGVGIGLISANLPYPADSAARHV